MRIGIDFDNTIVSYDALFHKVALELGVVPSGTAASKLAVRNYLRSVDQEIVWTEMQGYVYGARMDEAAGYPGAVDFIGGAVDAGHQVAIVSHKTKFPLRGPQHDLHAAARSWAERHLCVAGKPLIPPAQVFFELTREEKLARIGALDCDVFIDDLPEIFLADAFPRATRRILFDPDAHHANAAIGPAAVCKSWAEIRSTLGS